MKKSKIVLIVTGVIVVILAATLGPFFYSAYRKVADCSSFVTVPDRAIQSCAAILDMDRRHPENSDPVDDAHAVLWLHLAHVHMSQNDQEEFERNSAPYLNDKWPSPVLALYLGKTSVDDVYAKAKAGDPAAQKEQNCESSFYIGEWYLQKNMKDEARKTFQAAGSACASDDIELANSDVELKKLGP